MKKLLLSLFVSIFVFSGANMTLAATPDSTTYINYITEINNINVVNGHTSEAMETIYKIDRNIKNNNLVEPILKKRNDKTSIEYKLLEAINLKLIDIQKEMTKEIDVSASKYIPGPDISVYPSNDLENMYRILAEYIAKNALEHNYSELTVNTASKFFANLIAYTQHIELELTKKGVNVKPIMDEVAADAGIITPAQCVKKVVDLGIDKSSLNEEISVLGSEDTILTLFCPLVKAIKVNPNISADFDKNNKGYVFTLTEKGVGKLIINLEQNKSGIWHGTSFSRFNDKKQLMGNEVMSLIEWSSMSLSLKNYWIKTL